MLISRKRYKIEAYFQRKTNRKSYVAYRMAPVSVTLYDLEGHSPVAGLFKCTPSNICAACYQISTDSVLAFAQFLSDSWASCLSRDARHACVVYVVVILYVCMTVCLLHSGIVPKQHKQNIDVHFTSLDNSCSSFLTSNIVSKFWQSHPERSIEYSLSVFF